MEEKYIDAEYVWKMDEAFKQKPEMPHRFYRVYHMKDGRKITMESSPHLTYEDAVSKLWYFHPSHFQGADDMKDVAYITIEKRFLPRGV
ncbi:hypothetical protein ACU1JV_21860 [Paenibacillus sp. T2-29]